MTQLKLWYDQPAQAWTDALPLGNGRLGAMVYGGVAREEFQLNESTLWSGGPYQPTNDEALPNLEEIRRLLFAGRYADAQALADRHSMAKPVLQMSYQPAGNLFLEFQHEAVPGSYRRELDLETALHSVTYDLLGTGLRDDPVRFFRETFVSMPDNVIATRLTSSVPGAVSFELWIDSPQPGEWSAGDATRIEYSGVNFGKHGIAGQLRFEMSTTLRLEGGSAERRGRRLVVRDADSATILVDIATSFRRYDDVSGAPQAYVTARRNLLEARSYDDMRADHVLAYGRQFQTFAIDLGKGTPNLPTDQRVAAFRQGGDPELAALYTQYGRYLMLCSSQPGTQPSTLQGIWNKDTRPPWGSKYTTNINIQMNYWLPDAANLAQCFEPLIEMIEDLSVTGADMARRHYGAGGWVLHHNTDLWRATGPVDGAQWGLWPTGGAWFCAQLWDHAAFAGYPEPLVRRLQPLLAGAVRFALDTLQPLPGTNHLVTAPSVSPENVHPHGAALCYGPAMDSQILRDLFDAYVEATGRSGLTETMVEEARAARARLPSDRIGTAGQLQEWLEDWDMDVPEIHHRHVSHLYGLYPSRQITPEATPDLAAAARRSLEIRGDEATGWGIGWRINLWARLRQAEHAYDVLKLLLHPDRSYRNLFDAHPPFQIDGNFGGAAGILEMLVQSNGRTIDLLPALPQEFHSGQVRGIRARGGVALDMSWSGGSPTAVTAHCSVAFEGEIRVDDRVIAASLAPGTHTLSL